jgi:hypothetical protein
MEEYIDDDIDDIYSEIKESMKKIVDQTNDVLKFSSSAFKKAKDKIIVLENEIMKPRDGVKEWLRMHNKTSITLPDFFTLLFSTAKSLDYKTNSIVFSNKDALYFGFEENKQVHILDIFENLPKYFE